MKDLHYKRAHRLGTGLLDPLRLIRSFSRQELVDHDSLSFYSKWKRAHSGRLAIYKDHQSGHQMAHQPLIPFNLS